MIFVVLLVVVLVGVVVVVVVVVVAYDHDLNIYVYIIVRFMLLLLSLLLDQLSYDGTVMIVKKLNFMNDFLSFATDEMDTCNIPCGSVSRNDCTVYVKFVFFDFYSVFWKARSTSRIITRYH